MLGAYAWEFFVLSSLLEKLRARMGMEPFPAPASLGIASGNEGGGGLAAAAMTNALAGFLSVPNVPVVPPGTVSEEDRKDVVNILTLVGKSCGRVGVLHVVPQIDRLVRQLEQPILKLRLEIKIETLCDNISDGLLGQKFLHVQESLCKYYENSELFGKEVATNFPSAVDNIYEAGNCLALKRSTACVMHLMKALEVGLGALARAVGVDKQNDWGSYVREIEKNLEEKQRTSGAKSVDEQFYAEAAASFGHMRRAWRNPSMHVEGVYSQERAEEILLSTKSFMIHLASRLREPPP